MTKSKVLFFVPNIIGSFVKQSLSIVFAHMLLIQFLGYFRILLLITSWIVFYSNPLISLSLYSLSVMLDGMYTLKITDLKP